MFEPHWPHCIFTEYALFSNPKSQALQMLMFQCFTDDLRKGLLSLPHHVAAFCFGSGWFISLDCVSSSVISVPLCFWQDVSTCNMQGITDSAISHRPRRWHLQKSLLRSARPSQRPEGDSSEVCESLCEPSKNEESH